MTPAEFKEMFPEFATTDDAAIQVQLDLFGVEYRSDYGDLAGRLSGLYAAHQITVFTQAASASPASVVTSRKVDDLSWSYATPGADSGSSWSSTKYGVEFARLIALFGSGPIMSGGGHGYLC